jgi:hypothetical protein
MSSVIVTMLIELIIALFMALAIRRGKRKVLSAAFAFVCGLSGICSVIFGIEVLMFTYTYGVSTSFAYFGMFFSMVGFVLVAISRPSFLVRRS